MKKTVLFALPLVALMFAVSCKKQEAMPAAEQQPAATEVAPATTTVATPAVTPAPAATPAAAPAKMKKGK